MNIIFFGSGEFAVPSLGALIDSPHKVLAVVTQPNRRRGRRLKPAPTPVKIMADKSGLPVYQPENIKTPQTIAYLTGLKPDLFIVTAFGRILPEPVLMIPEFYALNLHASMLPKYRGAAPINRALINGEKKTGVTIIKMNEYMDRGDIILQKDIEIGNRDTALTLSERLSREGSGILLKAVDLISENKVCFTPQKEEEATYAPRLTKKDGLIDWGETAIQINNHIRGVTPWPGAFTYCKGKLLKIWEVKILAGGEGVAGKIVKLDRKAGIMEVMTKEGRLVVTSLQFEGKNCLSAQEFLPGCGIMTGDMLGE